jgi:Fic family protein
VAPDRDQGSPVLRQNLAEVLEEIQRVAKTREMPACETAGVGNELKHVESKLQELISQLDVLMQQDRAPDVDQLSAIIDVCACAHAEWIRIYPFANGNGRTARLWANGIALRYGIQRDSKDRRNDSLS